MLTRSEGLLMVLCILTGISSRPLGDGVPNHMGPVLGPSCIKIAKCNLAISCCILCPVHTAPFANESFAFSKSFALILSFKGYVHKAPKTLNR